MKIIFYEHFIELCRSSNVLPTVALKKMGFSGGCLKKWKSGANITIKSLEMVANFFNVPLEYFSTDVENSAHTANPPWNCCNTSDVMLGERIRTIRKNAGCTQKEFGELLNIPQSTLSAYETDRMQPTLLSLINIATKFNVSLDWLCGIEKDASPFENEKVELEKAITDEIAAVQVHMDYCNTTLRRLENQLNDLSEKRKKTRNTSQSAHKAGSV